MNEEVRARMEAFIEYLFNWNRRAGLTAFDSPEAAWTRGVEPSLAALPEISPGSHILDVGSGGGFPAVCLAVAGADYSITCAEPAPKKVLFLSSVSEELGLDLRVEIGSVDEVLRRTGPFDSVTVRGVKLKRGTIKRIIKAISGKGPFLVWTGGDRFDTYRRWMSDEGLQVRVIDLSQPDLRLLAGWKIQD